MPEKVVTATVAVAGGTTGVVVKYGSLLVLDPILLGLGLMGYIAAYFRYSEHTINNRVSGFIIGMLLANFSSLGLSEFALEQGFGFINPHITAVFFGFAGSSIIELVETQLVKRKKLPIKPENQND